MLNSYINWGTELFQKIKGMFSFAIYDKWGHEIFRTNDPSKGWDGNYLGNPVQNGNYVYHVQYINGIGVLTEKTDVVSLIR